MGKIMDILRKLSNKNLISRPDDGLPDYETRDKYLKSLRRQHRRIMDEQEKQRLKTIIGNYERKKNVEIITGKGIMKTKKSTPNKQSFLGKTNMIKKSKI